MERKFNRKFVDVYVVFVGDERTLAGLDTVLKSLDTIAAIRCGEICKQWGIHNMYAIISTCTLDMLDKDLKKIKDEYGLLFVFENVADFENCDVAYFKEIDDADKQDYTDKAKAICTKYSDDETESNRYEEYDELTSKVAVWFENYIETMISRTT